MEDDCNGEFEITNVTITNTYVIPTTDITIKKVWVGGPVEKPSIDIQLYRDGVEEGDIVTFDNGFTEYTWTDLDITDSNGKVYVYTVDELNVPENYEKEVDGTTITNTYIDTEDPNKPDVPLTPGGPKLPSTGSVNILVMLAWLFIGLAFILKLMGWKKSDVQKL